MVEKISETDSVVGTLYVISAPSGAGKTSLIKALVESDNTILVSVSHTTRQKRPGEIEGVDYHFIEKAQFDAMKAAGQFLEYAQVFDNYYGTSEGLVDQHLQQGLDVILEIDWQGAQQIKQLRKDAVCIFILPPSVHALQERLTTRGQDSMQTVERRMRDAVSDIRHYAEFDYLVVNDQFEQALLELKYIFAANRLRLSKQRLRNHCLLQALVTGNDNAS